VDINITITVNPGGGDIIPILRHIFSKVNTMSKILDTLKEQVAAAKTVGESAITLLNGLHTKLDEAIASGDMAALQALSDSLGANNQALADAVVANTVADPAPVE
jgi:hypothetical protein